MTVWRIVRKYKNDKMRKYPLTNMMSGGIMFKYENKAELPFSPGCRSEHAEVNIFFQRSMDVFCAAVRTVSVIDGGAICSAAFLF